jgi:chromosome partitioning protein
MVRVIAVANQKGGVGKTTTAINLAACLAAYEFKTLIVDIDPQANATSGLGYDKDAMGDTIYEVLLEQTPVVSVLKETEISYLSLIPSNISLVGAAIELVELGSRESKLKRALAPIRDTYDFVFIDCPPSLGLLTINGLVAADSVLIPIQCEYYALEGLGKLISTVRGVQKTFNTGLKIEGVLLTMYDSRLNLSKQVVEEARKYFKERIYDTVIHRNVKLAEAPSFGKPIILYDILSTGASDYMDLTREIVNHAEESAG